MQSESEPSNKAKFFQYAQEGKRTKLKDLIKKGKWWKISFDENKLFNLIHKFVLRQKHRN